MVETVIVIGVIVWALWPRKGPVQPPPPPKKPAIDPADVLEPLISDTPTPGRFWRIYNDAPNAGGNDGMLAQALRTIDNAAGANGARRLQYLDEMTRGWNLDLYSRDEPTDAWPAAYNFRGHNIGPAWLPRHADAVASIVAGRYPKRTISEGGTSVSPGDSYGLLWLPPIDADALKAGAVKVIPNADGSDPYYPPRTLLDLLEG